MAGGGVGTCAFFLSKKMLCLGSPIHGHDDGPPQVTAPVLQMDVWLEPAYVCGMYESCKGTNAVAQVK